MGDDLSVRHDVWLAQFAGRSAVDKIHVRNLQLTVNAGVDAWGRKRKQPALISVTLSLAESFDSAAQADALDSSTIDYGKLTKDIQGWVKEKENDWLATVQLAVLLQRRIREKTRATALIATEVDITYPKASLLGDAAGFALAISSLGTVKESFVLYLRNLKIPCLIGVNSNERAAKQLVVVSLWIENISLDVSRSDDYSKLEALVVEAISKSSFETLESLTTAVVNELRKKYFTLAEEESWIRLRVEKPLAVPFADAPVIEILRPVKV